MTYRTGMAMAAAACLVTCLVAPVLGAVGTLADSSGEVVGWGFNSSGQTNVPSGTFAAIAGGLNHSLGVRSDGTLAGWGLNGNGQTNVPGGTFTAIAAGGGHSLALRVDRTLAGWGFNLFGQTNVPSGTFAAIAAGAEHSLGLRADGTLAGWGLNSLGQTTVPGGTFTAIAAGEDHGLGLRADGTLAGWGDNSNGQTNVPGGTFTAIAAGADHGLGLRADGTLAGWGYNFYGQTNVPSGTFTAIAAGSDHSLALRARTDYDGDLLVRYTGDPYGSNGLKANLNRNVHVAGNARIESPLYLHEGALLDVAGRVTFEGAGIGFVEDSVGTISAGAGLEVPAFTTLNVPPNVNLSSAGPLMGGGSIDVDGSHLTAGLTNSSLFSGSLGVTNHGVLAFTGIGLVTPRLVETYNNGRITIGPGQRLVVGEEVYNHGRIELLGDPGVGGAAEMRFGFYTENSASTGMITGRDAIMRFYSLVNSGAVALTGGTNEVFGDIQNNSGATITVTGGATATFYDDIVNNGTITVRKLGSSTATAIFLGSFTGAGGTTGGGDIIFEGDLRPGTSPAEVTYENNIALGGGASIDIELGGLIAGSQYDKIIIDGALALGGTLDVNLIDLGTGTFAPQAGNSFDILDWAALSGTFEAINLPTLSGSLVWDTSQLYITGVLSIAAPGLPGDFNFDGSVDAADYVVLRKNGGTQAEFNTWRANFGATGGSGTHVDPTRSARPAVPEPGTCFGFIIAFGGLWAKRCAGIRQPSRA